MRRGDLAILDQIRPEIVLARQDAYCVSMVMACQRRGVPVVTFADAPVAYETRLFGGHERWHPPGLVEAVERWGLKRSRAVLTVSRPAAQRLSQYKLDLPIVVAPNGVHPDRYPPRSLAEQTQLRAELGIDRPCVIGFQGSFRLFHGVNRLRELMLSLGGDPRIHWLLVGDGPELAPLREATRHRVHATFLGRRPPSELPALLNIMEIALAPHAMIQGDFYFCPLKILEYAAAGCAVVASDQGDIPHLLDEGRAGRIITENSTADWIAAVKELVGDPDQRRQLGEKARRHVLEQFTWDHTAGIVAQTLAAALAAPGVSLSSSRTTTCPPPGS